MSLDTILNYIAKPAPWYKFWMPQSGLVGGVIFLLIIVNIFIAVFL